jgi:hypothetical protein
MASDTRPHQKLDVELGTMIMYTADGTATDVILHMLRL